jgi:hypothetical protein
MLIMGSVIISNNIITFSLKGKFDHHFVLQRLYKLKIAPTHLLMSGCKIYEFNVKAGKDYSTLIFRDSYLLMSVKLADLKKTFNLKCENKLYFPHLYVNIQ